MSWTVTQPSDRRFRLLLYLLLLRIVTAQLTLLRVTSLLYRNPFVTLSVCSIRFVT